MAIPTRTAKLFGSALRRFRRQRGLTQTELAERAGLRQATVSQVEAGSDGVRIATVFSLLAALDLEILVQPRIKGSLKDIEELF